MNPTQEEQSRRIERLSKLLDASAKEADKILKLNTIKMCNFLSIDIDNIYKSEIVNQIAKTAQTLIETYQNKELDINDMHAIHRHVLDAKQQVVAQQRNDWATACFLSGKPLYGVIKFYDQAEQTIDGKLKEGRLIQFSGLCMDFSQVATNATKHTVNATIQTATETYNGFENKWLIETNDAIYTNDKDIACQYYELKQAEHVQQQAKETNKDMELLAKELLGNFTFPTPYDDWGSLDDYPPLHFKPNGAMESPDEARQRWHEDRQDYFDKCDQEVEKLVRSCIDHNIPIIVVNNTMSLQRDINKADISLASEKWGIGHFCDQVPQIGETVYATGPAICALNNNGAFDDQEQESFKCTVYGSISGPDIHGDDRILFTDAGVVMSSIWNRELLVARKAIEQEMFVDQGYCSRGDR